MSAPVVTLVVPCYNEEAVLPDTIDITSTIREIDERKTHFGKK